METGFAESVNRSVISWNYRFNIVIQSPFRRGIFLLFGHFCGMTAHKQSLNRHFSWMEFKSNHNSCGTNISPRNSIWMCQKTEIMLLIWILWIIRMSNWWNISSVFTRCDPWLPSKRNNFGWKMKFHMKKIIIMYNNENDGCLQIATICPNTFP